MSILNITAENYQSVVENADKPSVLDFWAPWCVHCRRMEAAYTQTAEAMADRVNFCKVNVDDAPTLAGRFGIMAIPALVFVKDGEAVGQIVAPESKAKIEGFVREHLG